MTTQATGDDLWAWMDEEPEAEAFNEIDPRHVTAVMVVHNAAEWLARQVRALAALSPRPGRIIVVDNGSADASRSILTQAYSAGVVTALVPGAVDQSFGAAVNSALQAPPAWLWLLHDDSAPHPDALRHLLRGAASQQADVVLPKLLQPRRRNYPETLSEVGQSITSTGRRVDMADPGDIDQGQERSRPVLGGSTAGMLIRSEAWLRLGGLAPEVPLHRDGVDFGWRANEAGFKVITWPDAAVTHRQSGRTGERPCSLARDSHEIDRLAALRVVAARGAKPPPKARLVVGSWLRAAGYLLLKSPRLAKAELRALKRFTSSLDQVTSLAARTPAQPVDVGPLLPGKYWPLRNAIDRIGSDLAERYRDFTNQESDLSIDEMTGDDFAGGPDKRRLLAPLSVLTIVLIVAGAVAARDLIGLGEIFGGGLLPAPDTLSRAWQAALSPVTGVGGANAPWLSLGAFFSTFALASPKWFVLLALTLAPLLAALSAHAFLRRLGVTRTTAAAVAGTWAGAVILLGLVTAGDPAGMVLAIVLPQVASCAYRIALDDSGGAERLRAPASAAAWLLLGTSVWPALALVALIGAAIWVVRDKTTWPRMLIAVAPPIAFLGPWFPTLWRWPGRVLTGPDPLAWPAWEPTSLTMLFGRILPSGFPLWANLVFFGVLGLVAFYATCVVRGTKARLISIAALACPVIIGVFLSRMAVTVNGGEARALLSGWALLTVAALLAPVVALRLSGGRARFDARMVVGGLSALSILAAGLWAFFGFAGPVTNRASQLNYVGEVVLSARQTRVLLIESNDDGTLSWNVVDSAQPMWGSTERNPAGGFNMEYATLVQLVSGGDAPEDLAAQLTEVGLSHIWMRGFSSEQLAAVGNAAGLSHSQLADDTALWTVVDLPARARVVDASGSSAVLDGQITAADVDRQLVLAEPPDGRWQAIVGGQELARVDDTAVVFTIPAGASGPLSWQLRPTWGGFAWQLVVVLVITGLAAPTIGGTQAARRSLGES